jgi:hypothetical protein
MDLAFTDYQFEQETTQPDDELDRELLHESEAPKEADL